MSLHHILPFLLLLQLPLQAAEDKETSALSVYGIVGNPMFLQQKTQAPIWGWVTAEAVIAGDIVQVQCPRSRTQWPLATDGETLTVGI